MGGCRPTSFRNLLRLSLLPRSAAIASRPRRSLILLDIIEDDRPLLVVNGVSGPVDATNRHTRVTLIGRTIPVQADALMFIIDLIHCLRPSLAFGGTGDRPLHG